MVAGYDDDTQKLRHIKVETDSHALERVFSRKIDELIHTTKGKKPTIIDNSRVAEEVTKGILNADFIRNEYR